jgi:hypothetical protein
MRACGALIVTAVVLAACGQKSNETSDQVVDTTMPKSQGAAAPAAPTLVPTMPNSSTTNRQLQLISLARLKKAQARQCRQSLRCHQAIQLLVPSSLNCPARMTWLSTTQNEPNAWRRPGRPP